MTTSLNARPIISLEYVRVKITLTPPEDDPTAVIDAASVELAFTTGAAPAAEWKSASWESTPSVVRTARILVGPGGDFVPTARSYLVWYRFPDAPEIPARPAGWIRFE